MIIDPLKTSDYGSCNQACPRTVYDLLFLSITLCLFISTAISADPDLIGWYKLNENSGLVAIDSSGGDINGTIIGATWIDDPEVGWCLNFDGSDYVDIPATLISAISDEVTIAFWQKGNGIVIASNDGFTFFQAWNGSNNFQLLAGSNQSLWWDAGTNSWDDNLNGYSLPASQINDQWSHWAFVKDTSVSKMEVWRNGVMIHNSFVTSGGVSIGTSTNFQIGAGNVYPGYKGRMGDFRIYNRALSQSEIEAVVWGSDFWGSDLPADITGLAIPSGLRGDELLLVENGQPTAAIVIGRTSGQAVREAAELLQKYVEQMTGAKLPLVNDRAKGLPDVVVCVGPCVLTDSVDDGEKASSQCDPLVVVRDGIILLATAQVPRQSERLRYAVHELLREFGAEGYLGNHIIRPSTQEAGKISGHDGLDITLYTIMPHIPTLRLTANFNIRGPAFLARDPQSTMVAWSSAGGQEWSSAHIWNKVVPYGTYGKEHPEYFGLLKNKVDPDYFGLVEGNRVSHVLCTTELGVIDLFVEAAAKAFSGGAQSFSLTPNDCIRHYCQCDNCLSDRNIMGPANRLVSFANAVRRKLDETHPEFKDRKLHILTGYGYPEHRIPPTEGVKALPGVVLWVAHQGCHAHTWDDPNCPMNHKWADQLHGWIAAAEEPLGIYEYACYSNYRYDRKWASFPVVSVRRVVHDVAAYQRIGVGILKYEAEAVWRSYVPFRWVNAYAIDRAMADPQLDPDRLLRKLCENLYGPSDQLMYDYYDLLQTRLDQTTHHRGNWYLPDPAKVYSRSQPEDGGPWPDDISRLTELVNQAVWHAQSVGGDVLQRCIDAQKVWYEAVASLNSPDRDKNGPKHFREPPW